MSDSLTIGDIDESVQDKVYTQSYSTKPDIEGVQVVKVKHFIGEDGDFSEIVRLDEHAELEFFPGFRLAQVNRTLVFPDAVKAWHLHFKQDEVWYIAPNFQLFVGLWDVRKKSKTKNVSTRLSLGGGHSQLLFIPRGVAHGYANFSNEPINLYYLTNALFNKESPDEKRIPWDSLGEGFWKPERD